MSAVTSLPAAHRPIDAHALLGGGQTFSVLGLLHAAIRAHPEDDPAEIGLKVVRALPAGQRLAALEQLVPHAAKETARILGHRAADEVRSSDETQIVPARRNGNTSRWATRAPAIARWLRLSVPVAGRSKQRFLLDADDVAALVASRDAYAHGCFVEARRWERIGKALVEQGVATVGDLSDDMLIGILRWTP
jgi:hypothetical protein